MPLRPVCLAILSGAVAALHAQTLEPVLRSELAFARMAEEKGVRPAFLAWLVEDAKVFTPRMATAKARYGQEPGAGGGYLAWYPEAMGLATSGELAWSFGPWTSAGKKGEAPRAHGHFLSVWRRQADQRWRVVADIGVAHPAPDRPIEPFAAWDGPSPSGKAARAVADPAPALRQLEADLAAAWTTQGGAALLPHLAKGARLLRPGNLPRRGEEDIRKALAADAPGPGWTLTLLETATSGDLAWTCGETAPGAGAASFLRIWTLESGHWKVLFDVRLPHRPAAAK